MKLTPLGKKIKSLPWLVKSRLCLKVFDTFSFYTLREGFRSFPFLNNLGVLKIKNPKNMLAQIQNLHELITEQLKTNFCKNFFSYTSLPIFLSQLAINVDQSTMLQQLIPLFSCIFISFKFLPSN